MAPVIESLWMDFLLSDEHDKLQTWTLGQSIFLIRLQMGYLFSTHISFTKAFSVYITGSCLLRGIMATSLSRLGTHVISFRTHSHAQCVLVTSLYEDFTTIGNLRLVYVCRVLDKDVKIQIGYKTQYSNGTDV